MDNLCIGCGKEKEKVLEGDNGYCCQSCSLDYVHQNEEEMTGNLVRLDEERDWDAETKDILHQQI